MADKPDDNGRFDGFAELKRLIMYRLDQSDARIQNLSEDIQHLNELWQEKHSQHTVEIALLKVKCAGLGAVSGLVTGIITALVTAMEYVKRMNP